MIKKTNNILLFLMAILLTVFLPAYGNNLERYDNVLLKIESQKEQTQNKESIGESKNWTLGFEHETLPDLDGIWLLSKTTIKRRINPVLTQPINFVHCTSRLPFEKRDIDNKEVVINSRGSDFFVISAKYPVTTDSFFDPNQNTIIEYDNFGLKGVIDPEDLTYAYTLKLHDFIAHRTLSRQLWLKGKLKYDSISSNRITAKGYEIEYTPECQGWVMDEIEFVLVKTHDIKDPYNGAIARKLPIFEQPAYAEVPHAPKVGPDSAKDKSGIHATSNYKLKGKGVPGMW